MKEKANFISICAMRAWLANGKEKKALLLLSEVLRQGARLICESVDSHFL